MDVVTLPQAKLHLRVTQSNEDDAITMYLKAATAYIRNFLNGWLPGETCSPFIIPDDVKAAALLLIGGMYETRSSVIIGSSVEANPTVMNLLMPYRKKMGI